MKGTIWYTQFQLICKFKFKLLIFLNIELLIIYLLPFKLIRKKYPQDNITLVTALFKIESNRHYFKEYLNWVNNLLSINSSIVFFIDKEIASQIKYKRPDIYRNKTIWIEEKLSNLYSYKHFKKEFIETYKIDKSKKIHNVELFTIWAEKCFFLKKCIYNNYFNSKCFYWIDAGYFREKNMTNYLNNWPSIKKCNNDPRVIINGIRIIKNEEMQGLKSFDNKTHYSFMNNINVGAALFGGNSHYLLRFIYLYYKTLKLFIKKKQFIGSEQNLFTFVAYLNPNIVKLINSGKWYYFQLYLSDNFIES